MDLRDARCQLEEPGELPVLHLHSAPSEQLRLGNLNLVLRLIAADRSVLMRLLAPAVDLSTVFMSRSF